MVRKPVWLCVLAGLGVVGSTFWGCDKAKPTLQLHTGQTGGIAYEVRGVGHAAERRSANGDVDVTLGSNHLQLQGGQVVANGKSWGTVKDGQRVVLDEAGQVSVTQQHH